MKKISKLALVLGISTIGGLVLAQTTTANADEQTSNAQVTVKAGELTISQLTDLDFGTETIAGKDIDLTSTNGKVGIEDFRGSSSKGWTLTAKLQDGDFNGLGLKFSPTISANSEVARATETENLNIEGQLVASVDDESIINTEFDTMLDLNASLNIPAKTKANTYTTTIVWNLAATPETR
ncbi:hypothetical protein G8C15_18020 [Enterococcus casseliflavus]|nr:hypothetical protein [Enterococcus casseliflavus]MBF0014425.1 hypothetical protein [Enterococcus casseliflavus]